MPFIVKNTTLPGLFELLAPHSCRGCGRIGAPLCNRCKNYIISEHFSFQPDLPPDLPPTHIAGSRNGLIGQLIHDYKYHSVRALAMPLAELLDQTIPDKLGPRVTVVPLPTIGRHIRERGFDHTLLLARKFAQLRGYKIEKLLIRHKNTVQVGSNRAERLSQATLAYQLNPHAKINSKTTYLLLDDVFTTGATIKAATKVLRDAGIANIQCALLAAS